MHDTDTPIPPLARHAAARNWLGRPPTQRLIERTTLPQMLAGAQAHTDAPALTWYEGERRVLHLRYGELLAQIGGLARWFTQEHGVARSDRVIVLSSNAPEAFCAHLALMSMGAVTVPVSNAESARVLQLIADKTGAKLAVTGREVAPELRAALRSTVALPSLPLAANDEAGFDGTAREVQPDDPAVILFTSGTTSAPKGVCLSHYNLLVNAEGLSRSHDLARQRVHMCVLPLFHANAFGFSMVASLYAGNHVVLSAGVPGADLWTILRAEKVDVISLVPEIIRVLTRIPVPRGTLPDLKYVTSAAAPLPKTVSAEFREKTGIAIHQGYGLSECVNFAATMPWNVADADLERAMTQFRVPSIGPALYGCAMDVKRADGSSADPEEEGEVAVTGHTLMRGYWDAQDATEATLGDGFLRTGDLGFYAVVGGERFFFITGRKKEIIIRYGENLSPLAIEAELEALRAVGRFAVAGFANEAAGEEIGLYVVAQRSPDTERRVLEAVRACAARYRPRVVLFGAAPVPATPTGKVKRALLAQNFQAYAKRSFGSDPIVGSAA